MSINREKLDKILIQMGHTENLIGTGYIRAAVVMYDGGAKAMVKELYPGIARACSTTPARVERAMRHSIERAWQRGNEDAQLEHFGYSVDRAKGNPTVSEYISRMAVVCHED
jgi:two-component system response regulator (stage 0 sporulation protein A)